MAFVVIGGVSRKVVALTPCSRRCGLVSGYLDQLVITAVSAASEEYCQWESFNATCGRDQVILITAAVYGRMRVGRCVPYDYYLGCSTDVASTGMRVSLLTTPLGALFDGRVRSPVVAVLGAASLRRADPRAGAVQGPPVPQGPRRLHGRHLPVRHRSGCPHALHAPLNGLLCSRRSGGGGALNDSAIRPSVCPSVCPMAQLL